MSFQAENYRKVLRSRRDVWLPAKVNSSEPGAGAIGRQANMNPSLLFQLRNCLRPVHVRNRETDFIAGPQCVEEQAVSCLEILRFSSAADSAALRLIDRDCALLLVDPGNRPRKGLLSQSRTTCKADEGARPDGSCRFHGVLLSSGIFGKRGCEKFGSGRFGERPVKQ